MRALRLEGRTFGRLTVLDRVIDVKSGRSKWWRCRCICGTIRLVGGNNLLRGFSRSCGCLHREEMGNLSRTHGLSGTREYHTWTSMIGRCTKPEYPSYRNYGGRGICVCRRWQGKNGFRHFLTDMGSRPPNRSIDRIDNDKGYSPSNCRWATSRQQHGNTRRSKRKLKVYDLAPLSRRPMLHLRKG